MKATRTHWNCDDETCPSSITNCGIRFTQVPTPTGSNTCPPVGYELSAIVTSYPLIVSAWPVGHEISFARRVVVRVEPYPDRIGSHRQDIVRGADAVPIHFPPSLLLPECEVVVP